MEAKIRVIVAGGGTAGWLTAYSLAKRLGKSLDITLIESDQIGTVGVGEATVPTMHRFHQFFGIEEREFMRATQATFKLGIAFDNWGAPGESYAHTFGEIGQSNWLVEFHQYWLEAHANGFGGKLEDYCLELKAAEAGKFARTAGDTPLTYAFHLNATAYAGFLRQKSEALGVRRIEGRIDEVVVDPETGNIQSLELAQDRKIDGDFSLIAPGSEACCSAMHWMLNSRTGAIGWPLTALWQYRRKVPNHPPPLHAPSHILTGGSGAFPCKTARATVLFTAAGFVPTTMPVPPCSAMSLGKPSPIPSS